MIILLWKHLKKTLSFKMEDTKSHGHGKKKHPYIPSNRESTYGRLKSCLKKLHGKPELLKKYNAVILDQKEKEVIEKAYHEVSVGLQHYIPHNGSC